MSARNETLARFLRHAVLDNSLVAYEERARPVDRRLHIQPVVDQVREYLYLPHGLIVRTHHPECHFAMSIARGERRNDGVQRPFAWPERVGMLGVEHEAGAAIGQEDAGLLGADADP